MLPEDQEEVVVDFAEETERVQIAVMMSAQREVVAVQEKLKIKGYLNCEECGTDIPSDRRKAYPSARTCVPCQTVIEKLYAV